MGIDALDRRGEGIWGRKMGKKAVQVYKGCSYCRDASKEGSEGECRGGG